MPDLFDRSTLRTGPGWQVGRIAFVLLFVVVGGFAAAQGRWGVALLMAAGVVSMGIAFRRAHRAVR